MKKIVDIPAEKILQAFHVIMDDLSDDLDKCGCCQTEDHWLNVFTKEELKALTHDYWNHTGDIDELSEMDDEEADCVLEVGETFLRHIMNCLEIKVKERFQ